MGQKLRDELVATPPRLSLTTFPCHKPLPPTPGALTPPLQPMVAVPFQWEEAPGRPRPIETSRPCKPKSLRCLELPPKLLIEAKVAHLSTSPTTVLDAPKVGRSLSHRFFHEDQSPKTLMVNPDLNLVGNETANGLDEVKSKTKLKSHVGPWRWASGNGTKWNQELGKGTFDFSPWGRSRNGRCHVDVEVKVTRFRRRSKGSLYKLSHKSSRLLEDIYEGLKRMMIRGRK